MSVQQVAQYYQPNKLHPPHASKSSSLSIPESGRKSMTHYSDGNHLSSILSASTNTEIKGLSTLSLPLLPAESGPPHNNASEHDHDHHHDHLTHHDTVPTPMKLTFNVSVPVPKAPKPPKRLISKVVITEQRNSKSITVPSYESETKEKQDEDDDHDFDDFEMDELKEWDDALSFTPGAQRQSTAKLDFVGLSVQIHDQHQNALLNQSRRALPSIQDHDTNDIYDIHDVDDVDVNGTGSNVMGGRGRGTGILMNVPIASKMEKFKVSDLNKSKLRLRGMSQTVVLPLYKSVSDLSTVNGAECECQ